jgi:hypothetical protein
MRKYATSVRKYPNQTFDRIVGPPAESDNPRMRRQSSRFTLLEEVCDRHAFMGHGTSCRLSKGEYGALH